MKTPIIHTLRGDVIEHPLLMCTFSSYGILQALGCIPRFTSHMLMKGGGIYN